MSTAPTTMNIRRYLARFQNYYGPIGPGVRARLQAVVDDPSVESWDDAHSIILRAGKGFGLGLTLWQAVLAVDPTFPRRGPTHDAAGRLVEPWPRIPDQFTLVRALQHAADPPDA